MNYVYLYVVIFYGLSLVKYFYALNISNVLHELLHFIVTAKFVKLDMINV